MRGISHVGEDDLSVRDWLPVMHHGLSSESIAKWDRITVGQNTVGDGVGGVTLERRYVVSDGV